MVNELIAGVLFYPIDKIGTTGGAVLHAMKGFDEHFTEFGECYFSTVEGDQPKAWKKHSRMICNLFVPHGAIKFVFYDDRADSKDFRQIKEFTLSEANYGRLVIYPGIWFGFAGVNKDMDSLILNVSNIRHEPAESQRLEPAAVEIPYNWNI